MAHAAAAAIEGTDRLDRLAQPVAAWVRGRTEAPGVKETLSGTWLGHPVHPVLTDLPIGFWTSAVVLDVMGRRHRLAAQRLVALGVVSAIPTAITGASDWSDSSPRERRVGLVHGLLNAAAVVAFTASWWSRSRGRHFRGVTYGFAGSVVATGAGFLGGHLVDSLGVGVDHSVFDHPDSDDWVTVGNLEGLLETPTRAPNAPVLVWRTSDGVHAVGATCPHRGAPLDASAVDEGTVTCPWHGSCFRLDGGALLRGPAVTPLRPYEARIRDGNVEVRSTWWCGWP